MSREHGFTLTELLVSTTIMLVVTGAALTTFRNALNINDSASQLADANQNLRAGTNQLVRDVMMAGRIIGPEGVNLPQGAGTVAFNRPGPNGTTLTFTLVVDSQNTLNLPDLSTGYQMGPVINGSATDMLTIMTVDEFMPTLITPPAAPATPGMTEGTLAPDSSGITLPLNSVWLTGDTVNDTPAIQVGDLVFFKSATTNAMQYVTRKDTTHIYFENNVNDWFKFNQRGVPTVPMFQMKGTADQTVAWTTKVTCFRALMITYYVDNITTPGTPRLTRVVNHFTPQALAGVVEDLDLTYDLVDGIYNPAAITSLPYTDIIHNVTYNSNQIRKVNIHVGVRSEVLSKPSQDYVRNHISTAVDVRSLASVTRYLQ
jgi:prepilin-type N-terminal cleavage/methylation domain-containing protein